MRVLFLFISKSRKMKHEKLLLFLYEYRMFNKFLAHASKEYGTGGDFNEAMSKVMGFESEQEFNSVMYSLSDSQ